MILRKIYFHKLYKNYFQIRDKQNLQWHVINLLNLVIMTTPLNIVAK